MALHLSVKQTPVREPMVRFHHCPLEKFTVICYTVIMKKCRVCNIDKEDSQFYYTGKYIRKICKKCENRRMYDWTRAKIRALKVKAVQYLGDKCIVCGYNKCINALEFAHKGDKEYEPAQMFQNLMNWDVIKKELDKCLLKCANCHREETYNIE